MQEILNALSSPGTMSGSQWLVLAIGVFIVLGSLYFIIKLLKIVKSIGKSDYTPNIGLSKHPYRGQSVSLQPGEDQAGTKESGATDSEGSEKLSDEGENIKAE